MHRASARARLKSKLKDRLRSKLKNKTVVRTEEQPFSTQSQPCSQRRTRPRPLGQVLRDVAGLLQAQVSCARTSELSKHKRCKRALSQLAETSCAGKGKLSKQQR